MTDLDETPDAFDPQLECGAWRKQPGVIGAPQHTHVCRAIAGHAGARSIAPHVCGCGHVW